jgi:hypothetical protein
VFASNRVGRPPRFVVLLAVLSTLLLASGCAGLKDAQFRQDNRLRIQSPANLATVRLPFTVSWRMTDFTPALSGPPSSSSGQFAVFLDHYPMAPGKSLRSLVDGQLSCRGSDICEQPDYLADVLGVYVTAASSVTIDRLPARAQDGGDSGHFATIILLDTAGNRIGESVWYVSFRIAS